MSVFDWKNQPSQLKKERVRNVVANPSSIKFNGTSLSGSIATTEKTKRKPGVGKSATI